MDHQTLGKWINLHGDFALSNKSFMETTKLAMEQYLIRFLDQQYIELKATNNENGKHS